jgi:Group II intron, maturase-specific domain./Reverse transcriptase (RNA-dependent DNA polymerase).
VVHCRSEAQAKFLLTQLHKRFRECRLELQSEKTKIVCCNIAKQSSTQSNKKFDFLGYCFHPRLVRDPKGKRFVGFTPAISPKAAKQIRQRVRRWRLDLRTNLSLEDIAQYVNPIVVGWINYYSAFQRSALYPVLRHIDYHLIQWVKRKYKKKGRYSKRAIAWLGKVAHRRPELFAHWQFGATLPAG